MVANKYVESDSASDNDTPSRRKAARARSSSPKSAARSGSALSQGGRLSPVVVEEPPSVRRRSKSPLQRSVSEEALGANNQPSAPDHALRMATQSVPINPPMQVQEIGAALVDPQLAPKLLEHYEYLVNAVSTMQEQLHQQQRILEFMCGQFGTKFGFPSLSQYPVAATPLTDGRQIPGPKDADPRAMTHDEMWFLKHYMDSKQTRQPAYAKMVMRIMAPTDWHIEGYRLKPRLDLAKASTLWKLWYLTHDCYGCHTLQSVLTPDEMRTSENPNDKKSKKAKALTHATASKDANEHLQFAALQASAGAAEQATQVAQDARKQGAAGSSSNTRPLSPCAQSLRDRAQEEDAGVEEADMFGSSSEDERV